jgi:MFS family permease
MILTLFYDGIISPRFVKIGISKDVIGMSIKLLNILGYLFGGQALFYSLFSPLVGMAARRWPTRYITQCSFLIATCAIFMMGPSKLLHFPYENKVLSIVGFEMLGITTATVFVPLLAEIIDAIEEKEGVKDCSQINDKASASFNIAGSIGTIVGPILGGALFDEYGFETTCDILACGAGVLGLIYLFIAILPALFMR